MAEAIVEEEMSGDDVTARTAADVNDLWDCWFVPGISDFVRVPNLSQMFDLEFKTNGLLEKAMKVVDDYIQQLEIDGLEKQIFHPEGSNPMIVYRVEPETWTKNIMVYGHLDK
jgi:acetylornithine deacetylase/succinyl-diaminopimelate desuccinylase-like protein